MKTTALIIEYLMAGVLVDLALALCVASFFPIQIETILASFNQYESLPVNVLLTTVFAAVAYGTGIFTEFLGFSLFEGFHDEIKRKRIIKYVKDLKENKMKLDESPILRILEETEPDGITKEQARKCIGPMRFYVLMESPILYQDIAYQLHRLRLIRILFIAEVIVMVAVSYQLYQLTSLPLAGLFGFLLLTIYATFKAILHHFNRYCRAVERSYRALIYERS